MPDAGPAKVEAVSFETTESPEQKESSCGNVRDRKGAESTSKEASMARRRFQEGQVYKRGKSWIGRWREDILLPSGNIKRIRRARAIGSLREFPTKPLAKRKLQLLLA